MLTPEQLDHYPDALVALFAKTEQDIIADMARRISTYNYYIPAAQWQYAKLAETGQVQEYIMQELSAQTYRSWDEMKALFNEAGAKAIEFDDHIYEAAGLTPGRLADSLALKAVLQAGLDKTNGLFTNLTKTTANTATKQFEDALDRAYMQITMGAFDANTAIRNAIKGLSEKGIASITYPSGHKDYLDVAVRRATLTGVNQTVLKMQDTRAAEMGCDLVEVTAHAGARPSHAGWQGQIYSRSGDSDRYPNFEYSTGYGTGAGLGGWNCRHSYFPYFEGISQRAYTQKELEDFNAKTMEYNGKQMTEYEASQKQRYIERQIRRSKREYIGMEAAKQSTAEAAADISKWQDIQKDFLAQTGLKQQRDREKVFGFGRSEAGKVVQANKKHDILTEKEIAALHKYVSSDSYRINEKLRNGSLLNANDKAFIEALESALEKMPIYKGTVYRSIDSTFMQDELAFEKLHQSGSFIIYDAFTSTSLSVYDDSFKYQFVIESKTGRDIANLNEKESEILFSRGAMFRVIKKDGTTIYLEEV